MTDKRMITLLCVAVLSVILPISVVSQELSVDDCVRMALSNSSDSRNANLAVDRAKAVKGEARSEYFPRVSAQAFAMKSCNPLVEFGISDIDNALIRQYAYALAQEYSPLWGNEEKISFVDGGWMANVMVAQPIYAGGRILNGNKLASLGVKAAQLTALTRNDEVRQNIETVCWQLIALQEKISTIDMLSSMLDTLCKDVNTAADAGLVTKGNITKINLKRSECELNRKKLNDGISLLKMALAQQIGVDEWENIQLTDTVGDELPPENYFVAPHTAVQQRNEKQLLDMAVEAQKLQRKMTIGEALPSLMIGGSLSHNDFLGKPANNAIAFALLQVPITDWHKVAFKTKQHDIDIAAETNKHDDLIEKMTLQTEQAWYSLQQGWLQIELAQKTVDNARENYTVTKDFYDSGMVPLSELLEAQTLLKNAIDGLIESKANYHLNVLKYRQLTGNIN